MPMSNLRDFAVKVGHVLLLTLLLMLLLVPQRQAQNIPRRRNNFVQENHLVTFENSHILVMEHERDVYLFKGVQRNFTFSVSQNGSSMLLTVTPCASDITWTLYVKPKQNKKYRWIGEQQHRLRTIQELAQYTTDKRETYLHMGAPVGVYILSVTSLQTDSHVKIFATTNHNVLGSIYPTVPVDNKVRVQTNKRTLILDWPSGASVNSMRRSVEYCVTISRIKNFHSHCGALAHLHGDKKPEFTRWGFQNERQQIQDSRLMAKPIKRSPPKLIFHQCVANKTSFTHPKVRRGKTYYIDVFIIDKDTNTASAYTGTTVKIKKRKRSDKIKMKVDTTKTINLKKKRKIELKIDTRISRLAFEVIPCSGKIPFELTHNGKKIRKMARRWKRHFIRNAEPGTYLMTFPRKMKRKTFATVFITSKPSRSKITMPKKTKIFFFDKLTTCSKVTLAWMGNSVDQKYCLYKKKLKKNGRDSRRRKCLSPEERPESELEACMSYMDSEPLRQTMTYNVTGLEPATWYRFDVFVSRGRSASVPFKSVKVQTLALAQCSN